MIEYYLKQFNSYSQQYGIRLLDYVDIHGYFAPDYPVGGNSVAFTTAGDTGEQEARMNATRVLLLGSDLHRSQFPATELHHGLELHHELLASGAGAAIKAKPLV